MLDLDLILPDVSKPARYTGGEWNSVVKDWRSVDVHVALAFPDVYEIGMSNLALGILYDQVNQRTDALAERVYTPWPDLGAALRRVGYPLFSLESRRPIREFDLIAFALAYEQCYTNVLEMLDLAGIPLHAADRGAADPIVVGGGHCVGNPEPVADFFDAFIVGEGEEALQELVDEIKAWRAGGGDRVEFLRRLSARPGFYVPRFYEPRYHPDGTIAETVPTIPEAPAVVHRRVAMTLPPPLTRPIVPFIQTVHDRAAVELFRGCTQGCRYCQAGMITRPVRERTVDQVAAAVDEVIRNTGLDEISLVSLSSADFTGITELLGRLQARYADQHIKFSMPSLRTDAFSVGLAEALQPRKRSSLTFAPEAGSQRLRDVISKLITDDDLAQAADNAYANGYQHVKLYFMVGLPTETLDDVRGIAAAANRVLEIGRRRIGRVASVRVGVSTFVPKPHTPFQWCAQDDAETLREKHQILREGLSDRAVKLSWNDPRTSLIEAALSRGDRRVGRAVEAAWRRGAIFDAWGEHFKYDAWIDAFAEAGLDPAFYGRRARPVGEVFPWSHLDAGVEERFLRREWERAQAARGTEDCREGACRACGVQKLPTGCPTITAGKRVIPLSVA